MKTYAITVAGLVVLFAGFSLLIGKIPWGLITGSLIGLTIAYLIDWRRKKKGIIVTDERTKDKFRNYLLAALGTSHVLLLILLSVYEIRFNRHLVEVKYIIYYLTVTFIICIFVLPYIAKQK